MTGESQSSGARPLEGMRVLELGQLLAGPWAGCLLGYFGAEIIKIEPPEGGDAIRSWRLMDGDTSYWWRSLGRNKKSVTVNLRTDEGRALVRKLALECDVLLENFKPGTMEKWGLGPDELKKEKPDLIYTRVSGYGQTGPNSAKPGFASVCEGYGGLRYVNGFPDRPPVRPNLSLGDTLAGMHAAMGILLAWIHRQNGNPGQLIDVSIFESVYNMMEGLVPEYSGAGVVREPSGSTLTGIVPTNTYKCADGKYVIIGANGDSLFKRLCEAMLRPDMAEDERFSSNAGRVEHEQEIDEAIETWISELDSEEAQRRLSEVNVPNGPIYSVADMMADEHYQARGLFQEIQVRGKSMHIPAITPFLSDTPGRTEWPGGDLGSHTDEVLAKMLSLSGDELAALREDGTI